MVLCLFISQPAQAQGISVDELRDLPEATNMFKSENSNTINPSHWSYKTLEHISKKYGLSVGDPSNNFNIDKPLTRREAAVILVSLTGKINQDRVRLDASEKEQINILRQEFGQEIAELTGRVDVLEDNVDTLKGSIAKIESDKSKTPKFAYADTLTIGGGFQGRFAGVLRKGDNASNTSNMSIPVGIVWAKGKMAKNIDYNMQMLPSRYLDSASNSLLGDAYISTDIIPHNTVYIGQTRIPFGVDAPTVELFMDTADRSQIAKNYAVKRDMGVRVDGDFKYFDYKLAAYNGGRTTTGKIQNVDNNSEMDVMGWLNFKPLANYPQYGKLNLGSGYANGKGNYSYNMFGAYAGYKLGKFGLKYETAFADNGYGAGTSGYAKRGINSGGYYIIGLYDLTKKLQLVARYDTFDPNRDLASNNITEYTMGTNYFINGDKLKVQFNYVYVKNRAGNNGSRLVAQTQYIF